LKKPLTRARFLATTYDERRTTNDGELLLSDCELMLANDGGINTIGQRKLRVNSDLRIFRSQKFIHEEFESEVRHFDAIQGNGIHVDVSRSAGPVRVRYDYHHVYTAEN